MNNEAIDRGIRFINDAYEKGHYIRVFDLRQVLEAMKEPEIPTTDPNAVPPHCPIRKVYEKWNKIDIHHQANEFDALTSMWNAIKKYCEEEK